ncbi:response regulator [Pararhodobacter oceanensis]|nr:response regulator [Pararhodobacter oceanensis]
MPHLSPDRSLTPGPQTSPLSAASNGPAPMTDEPFIPGFAIPPHTMLLVEDSRLAAEAVRLICRRSGIRLRRVETLASAALHLKTYRPDIVLIDLGLPDGSGLDLIRALAELSERPERIVAISGHDEMREVALDAGADAFLLKPVSMAQHLRALTGYAPLPSADLAAMDRALGLCAQARSGQRNAGADPLALRDDLRKMRALLGGPEGRRHLQYAGQFLVSVGRALADEGFAEAAQSAVARGDPAALMALMEEQEPAGPLI